MLGAKALERLEARVKRRRVRALERLTVMVLVMLICRRQRVLTPRLPVLMTRRLLLVAIIGWLAGLLISSVWLLRQVVRVLRNPDFVKPRMHQCLGRRDAQLRPEL